MMPDRPGHFVRQRPVGPLSYPLVSLPWRAGRYFWQGWPPSPLDLLLSAIIAQGILAWAERSSWIPAVASSKASDWTHEVSNWGIAIAMSALGFAVVTFFYQAISLAERRLLRTVSALKHEPWFRELPIVQRRWLLAAYRTRMIPRTRHQRRPWRGAGVVATGSTGGDCCYPEVLPAEGEWLSRSGPAVLMVRDCTANLMLLLLCLIALAPMVVFMVRHGVLNPRPSVVIATAIGTYCAIRWLVAVGGIGRGWFDAHIDIGSLEFTGPWRTGSFERDKTIVFLLAAGPFVDACFIHVSGRHARMLLTRHGAWKMMRIWGR